MGSRLRPCARLVAQTIVSGSFSFCLASLAAVEPARVLRTLLAEAAHIRQQPRRLVVVLFLEAHLLHTRGERAEVDHMHGVANADFGLLLEALHDTFALALDHEPPAKQYVFVAGPPPGLVMLFKMVRCSSKPEPSI